MTYETLLVDNLESSCNTFDRHLDVGNIQLSSIEVRVILKTSVLVVLERHGDALDEATLHFDDEEVLHLDNKFRLSVVVE